MTDINHDPLADAIQQPENTRATMGHNQPPEETSPDDPLVNHALVVINGASECLKERADIEAWTAEIAAEINAMISDIDAAHKRLDDQRLDEGRAFKKQQEAKYNAPLAKLLIAKTSLVDKRRAYLRKEEDRLAIEAKRLQEEAETAQRAAEEKAQQAQANTNDPLQAELDADMARRAAQEKLDQAAQAPAKAHIGGASSGRVTGLRDVWSAEITDLSAAFKHYNAKKHPSKPILEAAIRAAIESIANREAATVKDLTKAPPGITFHKDRR